MGCVCGCHEKLDAIGVLGCCFECQADHDTMRNALLQIDAWERYHALLAEELESAVGTAYIHGWRSTPERIEAGKKFRAELGILDNTEKRKVPS